MPGFDAQVNLLRCVTYSGCIASIKESFKPFTFQQVAGILIKDSGTRVSSEFLGFLQMDFNGFARSPSYLKLMFPQLADAYSLLVTDYKELCLTRNQNCQLMSELQAYKEIFSQYKGGMGAVLGKVCEYIKMYQGKQLLIQYAQDGVTVSVQNMVKLNKFLELIKNQLTKLSY